MISGQPNYLNHVQYKMATVLRHRDHPKLLCTLYCIVRESKHGILNFITVKETDDGFSLQGKSYHSMRKK